MVVKGQFLERPTLIPLANGLVLEGVSHRGEKKPGLLVLPPPPLEGGGMDHVVGAELAYAISRAGHPTLRFNYRGVGGSQGKPSQSPMDWLEDALAAHELARENSAGAPPVIATIGASDAVALKLIELQPVAGLALINPSLARPDDFEGREKLAWPLGVVVGEHDTTQERGRWASVLDRLEGRFTLIPGANRTFQRNLPMVGQAVASLLSTLTG
jgi:alpha/beta superfamily hydrolase